MMLLVFVRKIAVRTAAVMLLLCVGSVQLPAHAASAPPILAAMILNVAHASSYHASMVSTTTSPMSSFMNARSTMDLTVLHHGNTTQTYGISKSAIMGRTIVTELAYNTKHFCTRTNHTKWLCSAVPSSLLAVMQSANPAALLNIHTSFSPAGTAMINGQPCVGFHVSILMSKAASQFVGTDVLWLSTKTHFPVEQMTDMTTTVVHGLTMRARVVLTWSHWNDPSLTIPAIPGL